MAKNSGCFVTTKTGKTGKSYYKDKLVNGKMIVHVDGETMAYLCDPKTVKITGYFDGEDNENIK